MAMSEALKAQLKAQQKHQQGKQEVMVSSTAAQIAKYRNTSSGIPIKIMTGLLFALTGVVGYDLYQKKRFPHQHGVTISGGLADLWRRM